MSEPIILVDDDPEDEEILREALQQLNIQNELIHFNECSRAFDYLKSTSDIPFIIFSDVNLPRKNGIEFKREIDEDPELREKSIPFVFLSTSTDPKSVNIAYKEMTVQGFFKKPSNFQELKSVVKLVLDYWKICRHPNSK